MPTQSTGVDEMVWQLASISKLSCPVVDVASEKVPFGFADHVPLTTRDPVTGGAGQVTPIGDKSSLPVTFRHAELTFQEPTMLPPQPVAFEHDAPAPLAPGSIAPGGFVVLDPLLHATRAATVAARKPDTTFIDRIPRFELGLSSAREWTNRSAHRDSSIVASSRDVIDSAWVAQGSAHRYSSASRSAFTRGVFSHKRFADNESRRASFRI